MYATAGFTGHEKMPVNQALPVFQPQFYQLLYQNEEINNMEELKNHIYDEHNGLRYTLVGDYYIPDLQLPEETCLIGIWGRMHVDYLEQQYPVLYNDLILTGKLWTYLADLNEQSRERMNRLTNQMKTAENITEELKAHHPMAWVGIMNNIRNQAEEIVRSKIIYH